MKFNDDLKSDDLKYVNVEALVRSAQLKLRERNNKDCVTKNDNTKLIKDTKTVKNRFLHFYLDKKLNYPYSKFKKYNDLKKLEDPNKVTIIYYYY